ncbi:MAG: hypothetical protein ABIB47_04650 [Candidatus Woesearchaeota archaeon]
MYELGTQRTDMEVALFIATHIRHPCKVNVEEQEHDLKEFYIRLARGTIPQLRDEQARGFLEKVIEEYT